MTDDPLDDALANLEYDVLTPSSPRYLGVRRAVLDAAPLMEPATRAVFAAACADDRLHVAAWNDGTLSCWPWDPATDDARELLPTLYLNDADGVAMVTYSDHVEWLREGWQT